MKPAAGRLRERARKADPNRSLLGVDDMHCCGDPAEPAGARRDLRVPIRNAPVGQNDGDRTAARVTSVLPCDQPFCRSQSGRQRSTPARREGTDRCSGTLYRCAWLEKNASITITERDHSDAVTVDVRLAQQRKQRPLDLRETPARSHRPAGVHDQTEKHSLSPGSNVLVQGVASSVEDPLAKRGNDGEIVALS